jgi:hypothetical protein
MVFILQHGKFRFGGLEIRKRIREGLQVVFGFEDGRRSL